VVLLFRLCKLQYGSCLRNKKNCTFKIRCKTLQNSGTMAWICVRDYKLLALSLVGIYTSLGWSLSYTVAFCFLLSSQKSHARLHFVESVVIRFSRFSLALKAKQTLQSSRVSLVSNAQLTVHSTSSRICLYCTLYCIGIHVYSKFGTVRTPRTTALDWTCLFTSISLGRSALLIH